VAQEADACHTREYVDRKKNNVIFIYMYLYATFTKPDDFAVEMLSADGTPQSKV